jgi:hypothetical protein
MLHLDESETLSTCVRARTSLLGLQITIALFVSILKIRLSARSKARFRTVRLKQPSCCLRNERLLKLLKLCRLPLGQVLVKRLPLR